MTRRELRIVHDGEGSPPPRRAPVHGTDGSLLCSGALDALLERGLQAIVALTGARGGAMRLVSPDGRGMRLVSALGMSPESLLEERLVQLDCGVCGVAFRSDGTHLDARPVACARHLGNDQGACGPVLAVPMHCDGHPVGVFNLFFDDAARVPGDVSRLIEPTARMLDLILENALVEHERLRASLASERKMCAGEVHDSLAQGLAYMRMRMPLLLDAIRAGQRGPALKYFEDVNEAMGEAHGRLRQLITQFRCEIDGGLVRALEKTVKGFEGRTGVRLVLDNRASTLRLTEEQELQIYQIVQEALANVVRHAGARNARILIERDATRMRVSVEDDGCGAPRRARGADRGEHYGLDIMRERARRIGGSLEIRGTPGKGTRVRVTLPAPRLEASIA